MKIFEENEQNRGFFLFYKKKIHKKIQTFYLNDQTTQFQNYPPKKKTKPNSKIFQRQTPRIQQHIYSPKQN